MLDQFFADIWVEGEISNLRAYPSGHFYFTLKDQNSQLPAVCFKSSAQRLKFKLADGLLVTGHGRLDLYPPSGKFQVILDEIEPKGRGALQLAFEQLKARLVAEGLFDETRKRPLPRLPRTVGIVTSPAGAAIRDMLKTLRIHGAKVSVVLYPAQVQGEGAAAQIAQGIERLNSRGDIDVIIAGRGGGSLEDLWPFNEEVVARAIAASRVPVISAVGHEVDFTIADFVADVRAATPTAAAQLVASGWEEMCRRLGEFAQELSQAMEQAMLDREQRLEGLAVRMEREVSGLKYRATSRLRTLTEQASRLVQAGLSRDITRWKTAVARLDTLSPLASLSRGYAICQKPDGSVVSSISQTKPGEDLNVRLTDGTLACEVEQIAADERR
jgi:exodeoxyribonuclease VII large subunit